MPNVCYFEIPVDDMSRAQRFYQDLFQWQFEKMPSAMPEIDYHTIQTGTPTEEGLPCGGMMKRQMPGHAMTPYVNVDSIEDYCQKVQQLGGKVLMTKTPVTGQGYFALCLDPENNPLGLWRCDESAP